MQYGDLTYLEILEVAQADWPIIVPTGCTEQQGPHLPVDFDTYWANRIAEDVSAMAEESHGISSLVLPALPFGPTPEHKGYRAGYVDLPQSLHEQVVYEILSSLVEQGFRRLLLMLGCGQHHLTAPVERLNRVHEGRVHIRVAQLPLNEIWCQLGDPRVPGGHADSFATSISLYLRPGSVRRELIRDPHSAPVDWDDPDLDFSAVSSTGVIGDPTHASAELGARLWAKVIEAGVRELAALVEVPLAESL